MDDVTFVPLTAAEVKTEKVKGLNGQVSDFFNPIFLGTWKTWELRDQIVFRHKLEGFFESASTLRSKFDAAVWEGHEDGSVDLRVESIRAKRKDDAETPGRKAKEKKMEDILLK